MQDDICKIPVSATFTIVDGKAVMTAAEYAEISADAIAAYLVDKLGILQDEGRRIGILVYVFPRNRRAGI